MRTLFTLFTALTFVTISSTADAAKKKAKAATKPAPAAAPATHTAAATPAPAPAPTPAPSPASSPAPAATPAAAPEHKSESAAAVEAKPVNGWIINDRQATHPQNNLSVMGQISPFGGTFTAGAGAWYAIVNQPMGFIEQWNDSFDIEVGGFLQYNRYSYFGFTESWYRLSPMGGVRWNFYLTPEWTVFATAKLGFGIGFGETDNFGGAGGTVGTSGIIFDGAAGALWNFSKDMSLRLEWGIFGITAGVTMPM